MGLFVEVDQEDRLGETALWRAVIAQALMDARSNSKKRYMRFEKAQATAWLSGTSRDFLMVCTLADLAPDYVRHKAKIAIKDSHGAKRKNLNKLIIKKDRIKDKNTTINSNLFQKRRKFYDEIY